MQDGVGRVNYMLFYLLSWLLQPLLSGLQVLLCSESAHYHCYFESWQSGRAFNLLMGESKSFVLSGDHQINTELGTIHFGLLPKICSDS